MNDIESIIDQRLKLQYLDHNFPVMFNNGMLVTEFKMTCAKCQMAYTPDDEVRGSVKKLSPSEFLIEGIGYCRSCEQLSIFDFKIYDDRRIATLLDGEWITHAAQPLRPTPPRPEIDREDSVSEDLEQAESHDPSMARLSAAIMGLRLLWSGVYALSLLPVVQEIQSGSHADYSNTFLGNALLVFVGYGCSVMLARDRLLKR